MTSPLGTIRLIASDAGLAAILWEGKDLQRTKLSDPVKNDQHPLLLPQMLRIGISVSISTAKYPSATQVLNIHEHKNNKRTFPCNNWRPRRWQNNANQKSA